jgi:lipopolysaccharide transport system ATP-binding protein
MADDVLVKVENVSKKFCRSLKKSLWYGMKDLTAEALGGSRNHDHLRKDEFWAVNDVSFELKRGECLGLIGQNGAGKTTLLRMLNGLIKPDKGRIEMRGRVGALIALGAGFNPILTGRENIYVNGSVLGLTKKEIDAKIEEIIDFADIREFIDSPVQSYSSGMAVRLGFSVATALEPDVLLLDEVLAVGDAGFRTRCSNRIGKLLQKVAVIFVTHNMHQVYRLCNRAILMERGVAKCYSSIGDAVHDYSNNISVYENKRAYFKDQSVEFFEYGLSKGEISTKEEISFHIKLKCKPGDEVKLGLLIINFTSCNGVLVAEHREVLGEQISQVDGDIYININLGPIMLKTGQYHYDWAIYNETWKVNIAHVVCAGELKVTGRILTDAVCEM